MIARAAHDPHHALYFGNWTWGVQFHPEFDAPVMDCYIRTRSGLLESEGLDPAALRAGVRPTPDGPRLMQAFADLVALRARHDGPDFPLSPAQAGLSRDFS